MLSADRVRRKLREEMLESVGELGKLSCCRSKESEVFQEGENNVTIIANSHSKIINERCLMDLGNWKVTCDYSENTFAGIRRSQVITMG